MNHQAETKEPEHPAEVRQLPIITVNVNEVSLFVRGRTGPRSKALGWAGLGLKWDRDRQRWKGPLSLKTLRALNKWLEVRLTYWAKKAMEEMELAEEKRAKYLAGKAQAQGQARTAQTKAQA